MHLSLSPHAVSLPLPSHPRGGRLSSVLLPVVEECQAFFPLSDELRFSLCSFKDEGIKITCCCCRTGIYVGRWYRNINVFILFLSWTSTLETSLWWTSLSGTCQRERTPQSRLHWSCALSVVLEESLSPPSPTAFAVSSAGIRGPMLSGQSSTHFQISCLNHKIHL